MATRDDLKRELSRLRQEAGLTIRGVAAATDITFNTVGGHFFAAAPADTLAD